MYGKNPVYEPLPKGATRREQPSKIKEEGETSARRSSLRDGHTNNAENYGCFSFQAQNNLHMVNPPQYELQTVRSSTGKRGPKAPTMTAKKWEPSETRIRELWVHQEKSIRELREMVNEEFGFAANERQYKAQIKRMKLEQNVKKEEQNVLVRHIQHRKYAVGKQSGHVRVRGHRITAEKLSRWIKENCIEKSTCPPSPLPSCMSIYTNSRSGSPVSQSDMIGAILQRLLAHNYKHGKELQEAGAFFNDLQLLLVSKQDCPEHPKSDALYSCCENWNSAVNRHIIQLQNLMNLAQRVVVHNEAKSTPKTNIDVPNRDFRIIPARGNHRPAAWTTPFGRVEVSIIAGDTTESMDTVLAARVAVVPHRTTTSSFRVVFDFTPHLDPAAKITYQAMIPNDSEVFNVVRKGEVELLKEVLRQGTARLTDRDEEGRSLLNYAMYEARVDMCKYLLEKQADPNAMELDLDGFLMPLHAIKSHNYFETEDKLCSMMSNCSKLMLEFGADFSLEGSGGGGIWESSFVEDLCYNSIATLELTIKLGGPCISLNGTFNNAWGIERVPLCILADGCGYGSSSVGQIVDKAILLLKWKADISCRDPDGDTVLHTLLKCERGKMTYLSLTEPKQLLIVFISAGADVYAINSEGESPSDLARQYDHEDEWTEALMLCGYDVHEVVAQPDATRMRQTSKLSFEECCQNREEYLWYKELTFGEYCHWCGEKIRHEMVSFEEYCYICGESFEAKELSLGGRYLQWREHYLREKAFFTKHHVVRVKRRQHALRHKFQYGHWFGGSCSSHVDEETADEEEESNQSGYNDNYSEGDEDMEMTGEEFEEGECEDNGIDMALEEAGSNREDNMDLNGEEVQERGHEYNGTNIHLEEIDGNRMDNLAPIEEAMQGLERDNTDINIGPIEAGGDWTDNLDWTGEELQEQGREFNDFGLGLEDAGGQPQDNLAKEANQLWFEHGIGKGNSLSSAVELYGQFGNDLDFTGEVFDFDAYIDTS